MLERLIDIIKCCDADKHFLWVQSTNMSALGTPINKRTKALGSVFKDLCRKNFLKLMKGLSKDELFFMRKMNRIVI